MKNLGLIKYAMCLITIGCHPAKNISTLVDVLIQKDRSDEVDVYKGLAEHEKDAIPYLIAVIDRDQRGIVGFNSPLSSTIYLNNNYVGMRAAYMIERLLVDTSSYQIFEHGVIVKLEKGRPLMNPLSLGDMMEVKRIYLEWWKKNKFQTTATLKKEWKSNNRALSGSNYKWE